MNKNAEALGSEKISRLLLKLSLPATMGMIAMALYNVVDTIFVGRGVGTMAIGALSIVMPIQMLIFSIAQVLGVGGASIISRALGARDNEKVNRTFGNLISLNFIISAAILFCGYLFTDSLLFLFGSQGQIMNPAREYLIWILPGTPFLNFAMIFNSVIRAEGNARVAMTTMILAAGLNIIFDPIFIFGFNMGIKGAAVASVISQVIAFFYLVLYFRSGKSVLQFRIKNLFPDSAVARETFAIGISSLARHGAGSVLAAILNHSLFFYGGEISVAVYGVINRVLRITFMPLFGLVQGFLPITGYNYGAKNYQRVKETFKTTVLSATFISFLIFALIMVFARQIFAVFSTDNLLIDEGEQALRRLILLTPIVGFQVIGAGYFQALGKALPSFFLALSRQVLFLIPLVLVTPKFFGLDGIWYSFPIADALSAIVTFLMLLPELKRLNASLKS